MSAATKRLLSLALVLLALGCASKEDPQAIRKSVDLQLAKARSGTPAERERAEKALVREGARSQEAIAALVERLGEDNPGRHVAFWALVKY